MLHFEIQAPGQHDTIGQMPRMLKDDEDEVEAANRILSRVIDLSDEDPSSSAAVLGRRGGKAGGRKGGAARAASLSPERRREIAKQAAEARWHVTKESSES